MELESQKAEKESGDEIMKAYKLFVSKETKTITFDSLKAIAEEIDEQISDEELRAMLREANKLQK